MKPEISIIIPTYKRNYILNKCLEAIKRQTFEKDKYKVIVIDDGGSDSSAVVKRFVNTMPIVHYRLGKRSGPAAVRNFGVKKSESEIIAFIDNDCFVQKDWLRQVYSLHKANKESLIIQGQISFFPGESFTQLIQDCLYKKVNNLRIGAKLEGLFLYKAYFIGTGNLTLKRKCFDIVGLFDETLLTNEDRDFYYRLLQKGIEVCYSPDIKVKHYGRRNLFGFCLQNYHYGKNCCLLNKKWQIVKTKDKNLKIYDWDSYERYLKERGIIIKSGIISCHDLLKAFGLIKGLFMSLILKMRSFCFKLGYSIGSMKIVWQHIFSK